MYLHLAPNRQNPRSKSRQKVGTFAWREGSCAAVEATDAALDEVTDDIAAGCTRG